MTVALVIVCPAGTDPDAQVRAALDLGDWSQLGADVWALIVDDDEDRRRALGRQRQRRYRERRTGVTSRHDDASRERYGASQNGDAMSRWAEENSWSDSARHQGVTGESPLGGIPPVTDPLGDAGVTRDANVTRDARDARDAPTPRDATARRYYQAGGSGDTAPLDDLARAKAQRGLDGMRAALAATDLDRDQ
jgi:hypothetical protein